MSGLVDLYALCHPTTGEIRYIGKADDASKRLKSHMRDSYRRRTPLYDWIRSLGCAPEIRVLERVAREQWPDRERALIAQYRCTCRLLNLADGGDQPAATPESRAAAGRAATKARQATPEALRVWRAKRNLGGAIRDAMKDGRYATAARCRFMARVAAAGAPQLFGDWARNL